MRITPKAFGKLIENRRRAIGWSRAELARRLGVSPRTTAVWEQGGGDATPYRMINFAFGGGDDSMNNELLRRAIRAEGTIKEIVDVIKEYRISERDDL